VVAGRHVRTEEDPVNVIRTIVCAGMATLAVAVAVPAHATCDKDGVPASLTPAALGVKAAPLNFHSAPLATAAPGAALVPVPVPGPANASIVGLWLDTVTIEGQPYGQSFEAFTSDGIEILNDSGSPSLGNVCLGVWAATGPGKTIKVTHPSWNYLPDGTLIGTVVIGEKITVDPDGNHFHGPVTVDVYDLDANLLVHLDGAVTARRITVQ
jgi:hypothetical protein